MTDPTEPLLTAVHRELVTSGTNVALRPDFEPRIAALLGDLIASDPERLEVCLSLLVAIEDELTTAEHHERAATQWSTFVRMLTARWCRASLEAGRQDDLVIRRSKRRLALDTIGPAINAKHTDVRAGPLARFVLAKETAR